jgi:Ca-activated chloride channel homolog
VRSSLFIYIFVFFCSFGLFSQAKDSLSKSNRSIMIVFDASGSMNDRMNGSSRMKVATEQLESFIRSLPDDTEMGLVAYGNRIPGCDSARLYSSLKKGGGKEILAKLPLLFPAGSTPIARTLELVNKHLLTGHSQTEIILVSDGIESCSGDPIREVQKIRNINPQTKVHVLGLDVLPNEERDLQYLAMAGSGTYHSVKDGKTMNQALNSIWMGKPLQKPDNNEIPFFPEPTQPFVQNTQQTKKSKIPFIQITEMEKIKTSSGQTEYRIWYEYEGNLSPIDTDHTAFVLFYLDPGTDATKIPSLRISKAPSIQQAISVDHSMRKGRGFVKVQIPEGIPVRVAAELWDMRIIPESIAISESKSLVDAKNTETFDAIFR